MHLPASLTSIFLTIDSVVSGGENEPTYGEIGRLS